ncbi:MAG: FCD domain-containing protein [Anaerolineae bacterium]|nr:FCD domain-containing protein [Anaerolineae bacterium]
MFTPIKLGRASEDVVEQIKQAIFDDQLSAGDRLPPERELAEQFAVSRITIREALRILEANGLIEIRVGAAGGAFVRAPNFEPLSDSLTTMLKLQKTDVLELAEARKVVETAVAELAAQRATPQDLEAMEETLDGAREALATGDHHYTPHSVAFHLALARAAKNQVLLFTVNSFRSLFYEALESLPPSDMAHRAVADHHQIYEAVKNRDPQKARQLMEEHLSYFEEKVHAMSETSNGGQ